MCIRDSYRGYFENFYFMVGPRVAYNISEKRTGPTNDEAGYVGLRDDDMHKVNISVSGALGYVAVSYTHLDVYKRQIYNHF